MSTVRTDTSSKSLSDRQDRLLNVLLWQAIPNLFQCDTQFCNGRWLWLQLLLCAQRDSPHVKVEWVEIGGVRRPLVLGMELWTVLLQEVKKLKNGVLLVNRPFFQK